MLSSKDKALLIAKALEDKKGVDPLILDLKGLTLVADYFVLVSGKSKTQVQALAQGVMEALTANQVKELRLEGYNDAQWVLLDYGDVVVHIFQEEARRFYDLERLWGDAKRLHFAPHV